MNRQKGFWDRTLGNLCIEDIGRRGGEDEEEGKGRCNGSRRTRRVKYLGTQGRNVFRELGGQGGAGDGF